MKTSSAHFSVFLLLDDSNAARDLSAVFRKINILPQIFTTLKSFWIAALQENPVLVIVDVKKLCEGNLLFKEHPKVKSESLPLAFFYNAATVPLLRSTYEVFHLGLIEEGPQYEPALKRILQRVNKQYDSEGQKEQLSEQVRQLREENKKLEWMIRDRAESDELQLAVETALMQAAAKTLGQNFSTFCSAFFGQWDDLEAFSVLTLTTQGEHLRPGDFSSEQSEKYQQMNMIGPFRACHRGIEFSVQNSALEAATLLLGESCVPLLIFGKDPDPQMMIFIKMAEEKISSVDWPLLQKMMSGIYCQYAYREMAESKHEFLQSLSPWEMMATLDEYFHWGNDLKKQLLDIDFSRMMKYITDVSYLRFHWKRFFRDFSQKIFACLPGNQNVLQAPIQLTSFGIHHVSLLVNPQDTEEFMQNLRAMIKDFAYATYIEGEENVAWAEIFPQIKRIPTSSHYYLKMIDFTQGSSHPDQQQQQQNKYQSDKSKNKNSRSHLLDF